MRLTFAVVIAAGLAGCSSLDWLDSPAAPDYPDGRETAARPVAGAARQDDRVRCARIARERQADLEDQGFEKELQKQVYDATFADCMKWATH